MLKHQVPLNWVTLSVLVEEPFYIQLRRRRRVISQTQLKWVERSPKLVSEINKFPQWSPGIIMTRIYNTRCNMRKRLSSVKIMKWSLVPIPSKTLATNLCLVKSCKRRERLKVSCSIKLWVNLMRIDCQLTKESSLPSPSTSSSCMIRVSHTCMTTSWLSLDQM